MKIAVMGYSGAGKSTLAARMGMKYGLPVLHLDTVQFLPGWQVRPQPEKEQLVREFLDAHDGWVIDGNYSSLFRERRMEEADRIIFMEFNRFASLWRAWKRYFRWHGKARTSMAEGCPEKIDFDFVCWILWKSRGPAKRQWYRDMAEKYRGKVTVIRNQRQLDEFMRREEIPAVDIGG